MRTGRPRATGRRGVAWRGVVWRGVVWCGVVWCVCARGVTWGCSVCAWATEHALAESFPFADAELAHYWLQLCDHVRAVCRYSPPTEAGSGPVTGRGLGGFAMIKQVQLASLHVM